MRQQQVIHALVAEIEGHRFGTLLGVRPLLDVMPKDVQTNLTPGEKISLFAAFSAKLGGARA